MRFLAEKSEQVRRKLLGLMDSDSDTLALADQEVQGDFGELGTAIWLARSEGSGQFEARIRKSLGGTILEQFDTNRESRSAQSELIFGAAFHRAGLRIIPDRTDILVSGAFGEIGVEVKRVRGANKVIDNVRQANSQLEQRRKHGVVAIDLVDRRADGSLQIRDSRTAADIAQQAQVGLNARLDLWVPRLGPQLFNRATDILLVNETSFWRTPDSTRIMSHSAQISTRFSSRLTEEHVWQFITTIDTRRYVTLEEWSALEP